MKVLFLFIDGIGLAPPAEDNPVCEAVCPAICQLLAEHAVPLDACLGVPGLPQSATGQAALFTGVNAAQAMGRHVEGFPGPSLQRIVAADHILLGLQRHGRRSRFADAYMADSIEEIRSRRFRSVTTTMALTCPSAICLRQDLLANQAVCQDITREALLNKGYAGPVIAPSQAAEHLLQVALDYDFTLFEYFQTDRAGHTADYATAAGILRLLDAFVATVSRLAQQAGLLFVLTSDHGNIESLACRTHTRNAVPLVATGPGAAALQSGMHSLTDVTPRLIQVMTA